MIDKHLYNYAMSFLHIRYKWGGANPLEGLDCSGLVQLILQSVGADPKLDQTSQALYDWFSVLGDEAPPNLGTLSFYGSSAQHITHVGFCIDPHRMIEASGGGRNTHTLQDSIDDHAFIRMSLINRRKDLVAILKPDYSDLIQ